MLIVFLFFNMNNAVVQLGENKSSKKNASLELGSIIDKKEDVYVSI